MKKRKNSLLYKNGIFISMWGDWRADMWNVLTFPWTVFIWFIAAIVDIGDGMSGPHKWP